MSIYNSGINNLSIFYQGNFITKGYLNNNLIYNNDVVTITINPTPNDAEVTFSDYEIGVISNDGKSITVKKDTNVTYTITKSMYSTLTSQLIASENQILDVNLERVEYSLSYPDNSNIILYNVEGEILSSSIDLIRLDITIPHDFNLHLTNVNRNIYSSNLINGDIYTCFLQKGIEIRIQSSYRTGSSLNRYYHRYDRKFTLLNDTSITITEADYVKSRT